MKTKKLKVVVTGGIGSGKSLVSDYLEKKGFTVIKADDLAKELMNSSEEIKKNIIDKFGEKSYCGSNVDTKYLSNIVFDDPEKLLQLNSIVHPVTIAKINTLMENVLEKAKVVFVESAIVYEAEFEDMFDYVVLVYSSQEERIKRVVDRDGASEKDVIKRIANQIPDEEKKGVADIVIANIDSKEELMKKINFLITLFTSLTI